MNVSLRPMTAADRPQVSALHACVFGPGRFSRTAYRLREKAGLISPYCWIASDGARCVGSVTLTEVRADTSDTPGVLIGPVAVDISYLGQGIGSNLLRAGLEAAKASGKFDFAVLVGDLPFYGKFGFEHVHPDQLLMPGPVDASRLLILRFSNGEPRGVLRA